MAEIPPYHLAQQATTLGVNVPLAVWGDHWNIEMGRWSIPSERGVAVTAAADRVQQRDAVVVLVDCHTEIGSRLPRDTGGAAALRIDMRASSTMRPRATAPATAATPKSQRPAVAASAALGTWPTRCPVPLGGRHHRGQWRRFAIPRPTPPVRLNP